MQRVARVFLSVAIASTLLAQAPAVANAKGFGNPSVIRPSFMSCKDVSWWGWCK